ncbi:carboxypeptidase-like regulatory domain-containing protein [Balneolaceae bacterium YR4-1]|uniref:Carboxypeptidase-like regulatory domain-containing protein n=1 Tax=Halalkalibaculum roseum TaxID=2709311 RepID=A0A6M1SRC1_9BACT|nr:DUF5686 and carboxypeptidase-like regulatory domain-containing protein [Halalkalibaculum roseum]NGP75292.1 carboxypeptidase-like regulatory domain-containing protein [Halalkalibaculum roseum]
MLRIVTVFLFSLCFLFTNNAVGQVTINGTIYDAGTGETLPSANISIENTYRGTISNRSGAYSLTIPDSLLPATVVVRYIGFESARRVIDANSSNSQDFRLKPSVTEMEAITVTDEDPAIRIMRQVLKRKQEWRKKLKTYRAEAYTRQTVSNDTSIVMITESVSTAFWDKEKGHREVLKSRKQTANMDAADNFAGVSYLPNFYDDNIEIAGFDVVGVTHPDALKFYDFKLIDQTTLDDQTVFEIEVRPARKLQPLFNGTIYVLDGAYALLEVSLQPNEVVDFPQPIKEFNSYYEQQFNNYGQDFWLPADMRINGEIKIKMVGLEFPLIQFRQLSRITDYEVNVSLPDSLYEDEDLFAVDSTTINSDSLFIRNINTVPLSDDEQEAYATLDSTATLEKAFKPSGFLARFVEDDEESDEFTGSFLSGIPGSINPVIRYNRVDELHAGLKYSVNPIDKLELRFSGGYSTGYEEWGYGAGFTYELYDKDLISQSVGFDYKADTRQRYESQVYSPLMMTVSNLLGYENYYDYYRNEGYRAFTELDFSRADLSAVIGYNSEEHSSLNTTTAYDILGRDNTPRVNPAIPEGRLHSLDIKAGYNLGESYNLGVTGLKRAGIYIEYSDDWLGSDFDFTRYTAGIDWSFNTFYKRRFLPNTLDLKLSAGTFSGTLPPQRYGITDVSKGIVSFFGALKTQRFQPYEGEQFLSLSAEHNFRTVPFEFLGIRPLVEREIGIIVFGGVGKTWVSDERRQALESSFGYSPNTTDGAHVEAGVSLNKVLGLFRIDFAQRLDEPAFLITLGVARLF